VTRRALLDTGFVVALVNSADPDHERVAAVWSDVRGRLLSVEGVLVESAHLLQRARGGAEAAIRLVEDAGTEMVALSELGTARVLALMNKYADVPMDFVDAMLVAVAEEKSVADVLTLDRRGFETYRLRGRRRFRILP
jgi:predicted nucleic acid-binding protein